MYKTIRHGENSLQYTILPQNDDFRIEGKLTNASCSLAANATASVSNTSVTSSTAGPGGKRSASTSPRRRRTFFAYLGLIFVCTVIIGAVLIPFLVSAECLPSPAEWFLKTKAAFTHSGERQLPHIADGKAATAAAPAPAPPVAAILGQNVGKTVQIVKHDGIEQFVLKLDKTATTTTTTTIATTTTTTPGMQTTEQQLLASTVRSALPAATYSTLATVATTNNATTAATAAAVPPLSNRLAATITTRIIQVPLLKSAAKKPIMPPVLAKTQSTQLQQQQQQQQQLPGNEAVEQNRSNSAWMNTRWAYIDPSTYVQWSGYKAEDSVLLPALLGFALIGMILIITVCLVARNKRTIVSSVRKRNRNDIEEQGAEDNATLLTTTNLSDDD
ncbi:uncharacterized protein Dvir_GJ15209 [Drosophila virilis]|uniref:Mucin-5AC n=1 Tax=Drosophila virilis TaxID=7244 RepID=B4MD37_DROVI|nr:uncharacterized protein Dvir_GJ15209 [Drosophila virilis]